eukprot:6185036-Pleurochrysis_carterae.AAC.1
MHSALEEWKSRHTPFEHRENAWPIAKVDFLHAKGCRLKGAQPMLNCVITHRHGLKFLPFAATAASAGARGRRRGRRRWRRWPEWAPRSTLAPPRRRACSRRRKTSMR